MPYYPDPAGGSMYAANEQQAAAQGWAPSMGTFGNYSQYDMGAPPASGGGGGGGTAPAPTTVNAAGGQQLATGINSLLGAIASGNKQAFDEAVRQFNATFGLDQSKFNEAIRQFNENLGMAQAGLTGQYQGQQTQQAQQQAFNQAISAAGLTGYFQQPGTAGAAGGPTQDQYMSARTQQLIGMGFDPTRAQQTANAEWVQGLARAGNVAGGLPPGISFASPGVQAAAPGGLETLQSQLQRAEQLGVYQGAPTLAAQQQAYSQGLGAINAAAALQNNPFRQQETIASLSKLLGGQAVPGFGALGPSSGGTGLSYMQQMIDDIRDPTANQARADSVLNGIPTPNKLDSVSFFRSPQSTQNLILQGMQTKYGLSPDDALTQIKNTMPTFSSPTTFGTVRR